MSNSQKIDKGKGPAKPSDKTDKGKGPAKPTDNDTYRQSLLGNLKFKPMAQFETPALERIYFGKNNLVAFPPSNITFKILPDYVLDRQQRCLIDNLWIAHSKKDNSHFVATLNSTCFYLHEKNLDKKFKFYVVVHGKTNGIFQTWIEVVESIKDFKTPLFKGFNDFTEALDYARGTLGPNYYISPALKFSQTHKTPQYNIQKDTDKIIFCDHCSTMTEAFKRINQTKEELSTQNTYLLEKITKLELLLRQTQITPQRQTQTQSSPTLPKMDETGVHSPLNVTKPIVSGIVTTSPVQTVAGKDLSNPLTAVILPKNEHEEASSSKTRRISFSLINMYNDVGLV
ncbi:hypothetical protein RND71_040897 [Anisodus tanguticus]|uniref:Ribonuclease H1 N-terminal domain-containing protein n=1 Tax=Anisodus tanguticus TaxID=243964 RepID=A0AAE1QTT3_9SOLA|nr:hypothetical protein RND71_040897 [Anisodus tanguticus]